MTSWSVGSIYFALTFGLTLVTGLDHRASAQTYPARPITAITNVGPGGTYDIFMRALGQEVQKVLGQPLIVEPRPGGNFMIAGRACAEAEPNGYTVCALTGETLVLPDLLFNKVLYDAKKDFVPIINLLYNTQVLVARVDLKVRTLDELAALAKAKPKSLAYVAPGVFQRLFFDRFNKQHDVDLISVPFKGGAEALTGILNGSTPIAFFGGANFAPLVREGTLVAIAVDSDKRSPLFPDTPTLVELGYTARFPRAYTCLVAPTGTPADIVQKLNQTIASIMNRPDFLKEHIVDRGLELIADTPEQFARFLQDDRALAASLVAEAGLQKQ